MKRSEVGRNQRGGEERKQRPNSKVARVPHDPVNEGVLLAAACVDQPTRHRLAHVLSTDGFFIKGHPECWATIVMLEKAGLQYDPATMKQLGLPSEEVEYLDQLVKRRPAVPPNLNHHLQAFAWDQMRVEAARGPVSALLDLLEKIDAEPEQVRIAARNVAAAFEGKGLLKYLRDPDQLVGEMVRNLKKRREGQHCYPFGVEGFDRIGEGEEGAGDWRVIPGTAPGQVSLVTGVPGSGKSTFVLRMLSHLAAEGRRALMGAWEMLSTYSLEVCSIIALAESRKDFQTGAFDDARMVAVEQRAREIGQWVRFMDLPFGRTRNEKVLNDRNLDLLHAYIVETGAEVAIFDLFRRAMRQRDPDEEDIALERIQAIAQETGCHVCIVHQQREKGMEGKKDKRPARETIKGSGGWFEIPDTIIGVHMPGLWKQVDRETVELIMLKQRHGKWPWATEHDAEPERGWIGPGRGIDYVRPGEATGMDAWLDGEKAAERQGKKGGKGGSRRRRE